MMYVCVLGDIGKACLKSENESMTWCTEAVRQVTGGAGCSSTVNHQANRALAVIAILRQPCESSCMYGRNQKRFFPNHWIADPCKSILPYIKDRQQSGSSQQQRDLQKTYKTNLLSLFALTHDSSKCKTTNPLYHERLQNARPAPGSGR
jgi:hypothetical protein